MKKKKWALPAPLDLPSASGSAPSVRFRAFLVLGAVRRPAVEFGAAAAEREPRGNAASGIGGQRCDQRDLAEAAADSRSSVANSCMASRSAGYNAEYVAYAWA